MLPQEESRISVALAKVGAYDEEAAKTVEKLLQFIDITASRGDRVLVKPNLLRADVLTCTNAVVTAAVCRFLLDRGCKVTVGDSPGFGTAKGVAESIGLDSALRAAGCGEVPVISLDSPVPRPLSLGGSVGLSRHALEADHILNVPKLKAHAQMRVTAGVKNLFGCISGVRKAFVHAKYGDKEKDGIAVFPSAVADILGHLPPVTTLLDGIEAMHVRGPSGGKPFAAHLLAVSASPVALDTAVYAMLGVSPQAVPLWRELQRRNIPGACLEDVALAGEEVGSFDLSGFRLPESLMPQTFNPARLLQSTAKRLWARFRG
ncbi:DUF362 domain-containing protein [Desulfovibrio sp. OttesenSCG-928-O18]|nr:DUF362 domain-containing protein [Desulfovibrio sp. OttesenSCG-928-O18]